MNSGYFEKIRARWPVFSPFAPTANITAEEASRALYMPPVACLEKPTENRHALFSDLAEQEEPPISLDDGQDRRQLADILHHARHSLLDTRRVSLSRLWEWGGQWLLLGTSGSGKTTALRYLLRQYSEWQDGEQNYLPIYLELDKLALDTPSEVKNIDADVTAMLNYLHNSWLREYYEDPASVRAIAFRSELEEMLQARRVCLLVDGLELITDATTRHWCRQVLESFLTYYPGNRCLIAARRLDHYPLLMKSQWQTATLETFDIAHIRQFFRRWLRLAELPEKTVSKQAEAIIQTLKKQPQPALQLNTPFNCVLAAHYWQHKGNLPDHGLRLYEHYIEQALTQTETLDAELLRIILGELALYAQDHSHLLTPTAITNIVREALQQHAPALATESGVSTVETILCQDSGLLMDYGKHGLRFVHLTLQEYMAAQYLLDDDERLSEYLEAHFFQPHHRDLIRTLSACCGLSDEATGSRFIDMLTAYAHPHDATMFYTFRLAFQCMQETRISEQTRETFLQRWIQVYLQETHLQTALNRLLSYSSHLLRQHSQTLGLLLEAISYEDVAPIRSKAAEALGQLKNPTSAPALLDLLRNDPQALIRGKAAEALGHLGDTESVPQLVRSVLDEGSFFVRQQAAKALANIDDPLTLPSLTTMLEKANASIRGRIMEALGYLQEPLAADMLTVALTKDRSAGVRWRAAEALGHLQAQETLPPLLSALANDGDMMVRSRAAEALSYFKGDEVLHALLKALKRDKFPAVRWRAAEALIRLRDQRAAPALKETMLKDLDNAVRWSAANALGYLADADSAVALAKTAQEDLDPAVRWSAVEALGRLHNIEAIPVLSMALKHDKSASVRGKSCQALGELQDKNSLPLLITALETEDNATVRRYAAEALGKLGESEAIPVLTRVLRQDSDAVVRGCASEALGRLNDMSTITALLDVMEHDTDIAVRWQVADVVEMMEMGALL